MVAPLQKINDGNNSNLGRIQGNVPNRQASGSVFASQKSVMADGDSLTITCPRPVYAQAPMVEENRPAKIDTPRITYKGRPINSEAKPIEAADALEKYGYNKFMRIALPMLAISDEDNSYLTITHGKEQPWCADGVNYFFKQLLGYNPFTNSDARNLSGVSELRAWGNKRGLYKSAKTPQQIAKQMANINAGDVVVFQRPSRLQMEDDTVYSFNSSHVGVVVGKTQDRLLVLESNTNVYKQNEDGKYPIKTVRDSRGRVVDRIIEPYYTDGDRVLLKEYGPNELYCRGYSGYVNMQNVVKP